MNYPEQIQNFSPQYQNTFIGSNSSSHLLSINSKAFMMPRPSKKGSATNLTNNKINPPQIVEVYESNFIKEIKRIGKYLKQYPYIGMDTEFPGIVCPCPVSTHDFYYQFNKINIDKLKLIQVGITLTNEKGEYPPGTSTWQFNLKFNIDKDEFSKESISLLYNSKIDFNLLKNNGIPYNLFAEYLTVSGLVLNEDISWISFNGFGDFGYLLKLLTNNNLPNTEEEFEEVLSYYFPTVYDIRYLVMDIELYKGGLNKIANELNITRVGELHQAGSDSLVTSDVFFKIIKNNVISLDDLNNGKNIMYGIGKGADDAETIAYTQFAPGVDYSELLQSINRRQNWI